MILEPRGRKGKRHHFVGHGPPWLAEWHPEEEGATLRGEVYKPSLRLVG